MDPSPPSSRFWTALRSLFRPLLGVRGQNIAEYALLLVMVSLASVAAIPELACAVESAFERVSEILGEDNDGGPGKGKKPTPPGLVKNCKQGPPRRN